MTRACDHSICLMAPIRLELKYFIQPDLIEQEGIRTTMHTKAVAHAEDLTLIISRLYDPDYLSTFPNMRTVLNLTLYMLLLVELCGRGADIARHHLRPEHMCLRWEDVTFFTFQSHDDEDFAIQAQIKAQ
jgi:hypothetical protein